MNFSQDCGRNSQLSMVITSAHIFQVGLGVVSMFFNAIVVVAVVAFRFLDNKCNHVIANFSVANFLLSFGVLSKAVRTLVDHTGYKGAPFVRMITLSYHIGTLTAVLLWALSLASDRYVAIFQAQFYNRPSVTQFRVFAVLLWSTSALSAYLSHFYVTLKPVECDIYTYSPWSSFTPEFTSAFDIFYFTMGTLTIFFYVIIVICTQQKLRRIRRGGEQQLRSQVERTRALLNMILLILVSFSVCHLIRPIIYHLEAEVMGTSSHMRDVVYEYMSLVMLMDGIFTCAVYFARSNEYRQALVFILSCDWSKREFSSLSVGPTPIITTTSPSRKSSNRTDNDIHLKPITSDVTGRRSIDKLLPQLESCTTNHSNDGSVLTATFDDDKQIVDDHMPHQ